AQYAADTSSATGSGRDNDSESVIGYSPGPLVTRSARPRRRRGPGGAHHGADRMVPVPRPPPQHIVTSACRAPTRSISLRALVISTPPVAPSGCPRAIAPPL